MPSDAKLYRVFIASPGGLDQERRAFKETLSEYNDVDAVERGALFLPVGWELTLPGCGRPQALINQDIEKCDYFVLMLWDRWGSPTDSGDPPKYTSGIEEEYHVALRCFEDHAKPMRQLVVLFKSVDLRQFSDPGPQFQKVLDFKTKLEGEKKLLFDTFDDIDSIKQKLRRNVSAWLRDHERGITGKVTEPEHPPKSVRSIIVEAEASESSDLLRGWNPNKPYNIPSENELAQNAAKGEPAALIRYAEALFVAGRFTQASALLEKALKQPLDPDKRARVLRNQARISYQLWKFSDAEKLYLEALRTLEGLPNKEDNLAIATLELGRVYQVTARYAESEQCLRKVLALREKQGPRRLAALATAFSSMGLLFLQQSRYQEAKPFAVRALELRRPNLAAPLLVANQLAQLGSIERGLGRFTVAGGYLDEAQAIYLNAGNEEGSTAALIPLGALRREQGKLSESKEILKKAVIIRERARGPEDDSVGHASRELGDTLRLLAEFEDSEVAYKRALLIRERILGANHPAFARAMQGLALLYLRQGGAVQAEVLLKRSLEILRGALGTKVPFYASCQRDLCQLYKQSGDLEAALSLITEACEAFKDQYTIAHPETVEALRTQAELLRRLGRAEEAAQVEEQASQGLSGVDPTAAIFAGGPDITR